MKKKNKFTEPIKDGLYRVFGLFPPPQPWRITLSPMTSAERRTIEGLKTICLFLGPHRNLTTLTAAVMALHPNCQVFSHGGLRVLPVEELNFLNGYSAEKIDKFLHFALVMSQTGDRGEYGGSITVTHAFRDHPILSNAYRKRFGRLALKKKIDCLVWKEAHLVENYVAEHRIDLGSVLRADKRLRFIMPIRNPLHVAYSFFNHDRLMRKFYNHLEQDDIIGVIDDILFKMAHTIALHQSFPERTLLFFENEIKESLFVEMARFLQIPLDGRWIANALKCFDVQPANYEVPPSIKTYFRKQVEILFGSSPLILNKFQQYL